MVADDRSGVVITFRTHVVSVVAVLMALAVGIALGGGPLQGAGREQLSGAEETEALAEAQERVDELSLAVEFADDYAAGTAGRLIRSALKGQSVTVLSLPGADQEVVADLGSLIERAGGKVASRFLVTEAFLDPSNRQLVTELATQMRGSLGKAARQTRGLDGYELMAALLAQAVTTTDRGGAAPGDAAQSILAALSTAELMTAQGPSEGRGTLVLAVAGPPYGDSDEQTGGGRILATMLTRVDQTGRGSVLAGPTSSAEAGGLVHAVRVDPVAAREVSTVSGIELTAGQVATVLALRNEVREATGHHGSGGAPDGAVPGGG